MTAETQVELECATRFLAHRDERHHKFIDRGLGSSQFPQIAGRHVDVDGVR